MYGKGFIYNMEYMEYGATFIGLSVAENCYYLKNILRIQ